MTSNAGNNDGSWRDKGFFEKKIGVPTIKDINKYNKYKGLIYETIELKIFEIKYLFKKIKNKLKNCVGLIWWNY